MAIGNTTRTLKYLKDTHRDAKGEVSGIYPEFANRTLQGVWQNNVCHAEGNIFNVKNIAFNTKTALPVLIYFSNIGEGLIV